MYLPQLYLELFCTPVSRMSVSSVHQFYCVQSNRFCTFQHKFSIFMIFCKPIVFPKYLWNILTRLDIINFESFIIAFPKRADDIAI